MEDAEKELLEDLGLEISPLVKGYVRRLRTSEIGEIINEFEKMDFIHNVLLLDHDTYRRKLNLKLRLSQGILLNSTTEQTIDSVVSEIAEQLNVKIKYQLTKY